MKIAFILAIAVRWLDQMETPYNSNGAMYIYDTKEAAEKEFPDYEIIELKIFQADEN